MQKLHNFYLQPEKTSMQLQNMPASRIIAEKLRQVREELGLTQEQVAVLMKRPQSYVSRCEMGIKRLEIRDLEAFCQVYGKNISFFLTEETR